MYIVVVFPRKSFLWRRWNVQSVKKFYEIVMLFLKFTFRVFLNKQKVDKYNNLYNKLTFEKA